MAIVGQNMQDCNVDLEKVEVVGKVGEDKVNISRGNAMAWSYFYYGISSLRLTFSFILFNLKFLKEYTPAPLIHPVTRNKKEKKNKK